MMRDSVVPMAVYHRAVPIYFVQSLIDCYRELRRFMPLIANSSALPNRARTMNGKAFLESEAEWALLVDDDMVWTPAEVKRLLKTAKETGAKAVSGLTFIEKEIEGGKRVFPHAYQIVPLGDERYAQMPMASIPMDHAFQVHAVGGACFLVHRDVYRTLQGMARGLTGYPWQEEVYQPKLDDQMGEDLVFCQRIRKAGFDIWYEPRAPFLHMRKPAFLGLAEYVASLESMQPSDVLALDAELHAADEG
jgi:hypothetical protein